MNDYTSLIEMITNSIIKSNEEQLEDCMLFSVEREIGFKIDKEELVKALEYDRKQYEKGFEDGLRSAMEWIPVSERYPTDANKRYLVCYEDGCITIEHLYFDGDGYPFFSEMELGVVAWMPLPEPYKASPTGEEVEE